MSKYASKYTDRLVTPSQHIAELLCERKATKDKKNLWKQFWNDKEWNSFFKRQCTLANKLLKLYDEGAIIQALGRVKWAWSLATPALISEIEKIGTINKEKYDDIEEQKPLAQREEAKKKSLLDLI